MARKTKAQVAKEKKEAEALALAEELKTEAKDVQQADTEVETQYGTEEADSGTADTDGEQSKEDVVETTGDAEIEGVLEDVQPKVEVKPEVKPAVDPLVAENEAKKVSTKEVEEGEKATRNNIQENPKTVGIPVSDVPIRDLPGFEVGSKRNPNDPAEVRQAREALINIRTILGTLED